MDEDALMNYLNVGCEMLNLIALIGFDYECNKMNRRSEIIIAQHLPNLGFLGLLRIYAFSLLITCHSHTALLTSSLYIV